MQKINSDNLRGFSIDAFSNQGKLLQPVLMRSEIELDSSNFHYWKLKKLLPTVMDAQWAQLSIIDCAWIEILKTLKKIGCSIKTMKLLHKSLFENSYNKNLNKLNSEKNLALFDGIAKTRPLTVEELNMRTVLVNTMNDRLLMEHYRREISYLYELVIESVTRDADISIRIYENGICAIIGSNLEIETEMPDFNVDHLAYIHISLSGILYRFFNNMHNQKKLIDRGYITEDENTVITEMRNQNIKSMTIYFNNKDHKLEKIECDTKGLINGEKAEKIMKILGLKNYTAIEIITRDLKSLSFTHTEKKFFNRPV